MGMITLRGPQIAELAVLSGLCLRSKAHWGYDAQFMAACVEELTLTPDELSTTDVAVAETEGQVIGLVQIAVEDAVADLLKLFVDPTHMGKGAGRILMEWAIVTARAKGARDMTIEADPDAAPFYRAMGAVLVGSAPSESIPGRHLPLLRLAL